MTTEPKVLDDRLPIVLVVLDGLGDRPIPELAGRTPAEAAATPNLDALARRGASGWHLPFGWGRAPTSELAHWAMFGYSPVPFVGRAVLEALGAGLDVEPGVAITHAALRTSRADGDKLWITGRAGPSDGTDADALLRDLAPVLGREGAALCPLGGRGEAVLTLAGHSCADVTDSDPFFETFHPWLRPVATSPGAEALARDLTGILRIARERLVRNPVNADRAARGLPALDVLTTKWSGVRGAVPTFMEQNGVAGAAVTSTRLYRGLATVLGMAQRHLAPIDDLAEDLAARLAAADELITAGARFVHVHTKATDGAGHTKLPHAKRDVLDAVDRGLAGLAPLAERAIVAVTGDHATPSTHSLLHAGEPTPLVVAGPTVRADGVTEFGEEPARQGWYGVVRADELLALLLGHANRPVLLGHRITRRPVVALADDPEPMRLGDAGR
ncbi:alkaline phosphatase family protein [Pseudonocardia sp. CA-142604]|uniref:alkaline phosphatase family protein n=1 Tax=Pseudonocardia sp. CA-142604 TaxID=3240024 RepID=UPI003D8A28ED